MSNLTIQQKALLDDRKASFQEFVEDSLPCIVELAETMKIEDTDRVMDNPEEFLTIFDQRWRNFDFTLLDSAQTTWLRTRITYFIGELLIHRFGGQWILQDDPESDFFASYVIADFKYVFPIDRIVDPYEISFYFWKSPCPRSLTATLAQIEDRR